MKKESFLLMGKHFGETIRTVKDQNQNGGHFITPNKNYLWSSDFGVIKQFYYLLCGP
jgi:hypothetical protein